VVAEVLVEELGALLPLLMLGGKELLDKEIAGTSLRV
jgi:hypothetical protein